MGEVIANGSADGNGVHPVKGAAVTSHRNGCWYEEEIEEDLRWCFALNRILPFWIPNLLERDELESRVEQFDIIVGDLADPVEGGPCFKLYTKSFYEYIVKPKLSDTGMFVTQAGPAGVLTHTDVFSSIYNTLKQVFKYVLPYTAHVPSYSDTWGWVMASDHQPFALNAEDLNNRINQVIKGELRYLDGQTLIAATTLSKSVRKSLAKESHVYTEETARFVHGHGKAL